MHVTSPTNWLSSNIVSVLERVPLDRETKAVLLGHPSVLGSVYQLILAHEGGQWEQTNRLTEGLHLDGEEVGSLYWQAQQWAREISVGA